jgi:SAM-dependent methyltransferase
METPFARNRPTGERLHSLYRMAQLPVLQNSMYRTAEEAKACACGDIHLVQDLETGLIFNHDFQPELLSYDADYQNEQGISRYFSEHLDQVLSWLAPLAEGHPLLEIGCGKGSFLDRVHQRGFSVRGMDPTYEGNNPLIEKKFFGGGEKSQYGGIILRHVLEHIPNPISFLESIRDANSGRGWIYIEVPCFDWICQSKNWFDIFYEHVNYFRLDDFRRLFGEVHFARHSFGGQYLSVLADLSSVRNPSIETIEPLSLPSDFTASVDQLTRQLKPGGSWQHSTRNVVWGGASKGVIFSLFMQRAKTPIDHVIDINPSKQGKFLALTGLPVESPEAVLAQLPAGSRIVIMNRNYANEIRAAAGEKFEYFVADDLFQA